ncbi:response regulator [Paenibacillus kobensis]|uniref:response regulator n=1 Tax=Paenibacillus kobensis TaxID=59841 RepID=UPI000FD8460B|nr:response regulator [Paenibacillus kobensis]
MKLLIVDDEVIIRNGLSTVINWQDLGFTLLAPASSAEEAMSRLEEERPNIVLTDIQMGGMGGLELAAEVKNRLPDTEVIILTGYDTFAYVQQALRDGVSDYLLKMSRPEEIIMAAMKAKQRILARREAAAQDIRSRAVLRDQLLERLLTASGTDSPSAEAVHGLLPGLSREGASYEVVIVAASGWGDGLYNVQLAHFAVANMVQELIACEILLRKDCVLLILSRDRTSITAAAFRQSLQDMLGRVSRKLKCRLFAGFGSWVDDWGSIKQSYEEASLAFSYRLIEGEEGWVGYEDVYERKGGSTVCSQEQEAELVAALKSGSVIELRRWVKAVIGSQLADARVTPDSLRAYIQSIIISSHRWLERMFQSPGEQPLQGELVRQPERIDYTKQPDEALFIALNAVMELYRDNVSGERVPYVKRAVLYIRDNLDKNLTLQQVAKHVHLHPNHFSEIFKRESGTTYIEFVTKERMSRAMELLERTPAKISEIAGLVGYEDVKYFSQLFKKSTGRTPSEFRSNT